jgi:broad specificity phosphatase PhoE
MKFRRLFLVRHAESFKNIRDEHGGPGDRLSAEGIEQCSKIRSFLRHEDLDEKNTIVFWHSVPQIAETAKRMCIDNHYESVRDERLKGIHLGVLAGLSRSEALRRFPGPAGRLERWRDGKLDIDKLEIPEAESATEFHRRIKSFVEDEIMSNSIPNIVITGSRSTMIMILNIFLLGKSFNFSDYKQYDFDCASITKLVFSKEKALLEFLNNTRFLKENDWRS